MKKKRKIDSEDTLNFLMMAILIISFIYMVYSMSKMGGGF